MSRDVYFHQHCPVCGRMLRVRVHLLGQRVYCQHCGGGFTAMDQELRPDTARPWRTAASRADELLQRAALVLERAAADPPAG